MPSAALHFCILDFSTTNFFKSKHHHQYNLMKHHQYHIGSKKKKKIKPNIRKAANLSELRRYYKAAEEAAQEVYIYT
jgi:uncharacterized FAD-dependent dehydrogenase